MCNDPKAYEEKLRRIKEEGPGWYAHYVPDEAYPLGVNIHTHGFPEKYNHPDIQLCVPMPQQQAHSLLWGFVSTIEEKRESDPAWVAPEGARVSGFLKNHDVLFLPVEECGRTVLRVILPDPGNQFSTEPYCQQFEGTGVSKEGPWS
jgi:hypothetical protein